jgi:hypothetical protein
MKTFEGLRIPESKLDSVVEKEPKKINSEVRLSFFRHGEKDGDKLTPAGRLDAAKGTGSNFRSKEIEGIDNKPGFAVASPRKRAGEAAILAMEGVDLTEDEILKYENLVQLTNNINEKAGLKYGSKFVVDQRLDFRMTDDSELLKGIIKSQKEGKMLKWFVEESDQVFAGEKNQEENWGYSRMAANFAELIKKYFRTAKNFDTLVKKKKENEEEIFPVLERYIGSHTPNIDSFLVKLITKVKGEEIARKFVDLNSNGIKELEGFKVEIKSFTDQSEPQIKITYKSRDNNKDFQFETEITPEILEEIIEEGGGEIGWKGQSSK